jgi:hypothetical protein
MCRIKFPVPVCVEVISYETLALLIVLILIGMIPAVVGALGTFPKTIAGNDFTLPPEFSQFQVQRATIVPSGLVPPLMQCDHPLSVPLPQVSIWTWYSPTGTKASASQDKGRPLAMDVGVPVGAGVCVDVGGSVAVCVVVNVGMGVPVGVGTRNDPQAVRNEFDRRRITVVTRNHFFIPIIRSHMLISQRGGGRSAKGTP